MLPLCCWLMEFLWSKSYALMQHVLSFSSINWDTHLTWCRSSRGHHTGKWYTDLFSRAPSLSYKKNKNKWHTRIRHVFSHSPCVPLTHSHTRTNTPHAFLFQCFESSCLTQKKRWGINRTPLCTHATERHTQTKKGQKNCLIIEHALVSRQG